MARSRKSSIKVPVEVEVGFEKSPAAPARPAVTKLPDRTVQLTAKRAFLARSTDPVVASFLYTERLSGKTRKMSREQWLEELARFTKAPR